jgi:hypothetical protein
MFQFNIGNIQMKDFYFDGEPLLMPEGTIMAHDGKVWGLYHNYNLNTTFIVTRMLREGKRGWFVRVFPSGIMNLSYAHDFVKNRCSSCIEKATGVIL